MKVFFVSYYRHEELKYHLMSDYRLDGDHFTVKDGLSMDGPISLYSMSCIA